MAKDGPNDETEELEEDDEEDFIHCPICNEKCYIDRADCEHILFGCFAGEISYFFDGEICSLLEETMTEIGKICHDSGMLFTILSDLSEYFIEVEFPTRHELYSEFYFSERNDIADIITNYKIQILKNLSEEQED